MQDNVGDETDWLIEDLDTAQPAAHGQPWRVLVVDDEPDVHAVTRLALLNVSYKGKAVEILSAYTGAEGIDMLRHHPDVALVLLDVMMETDDAGLQMAKRVREELRNDLVRVVLRTGQSARLSERQVVMDYEINGYKVKSELTLEKLFTTVVTSMRDYEALLELKAKCDALEARTSSQGVG
jgi:CheY-like chemotaxis protein